MEFDRDAAKKDVGLNNAIANLRDAARQLLNFERDRQRIKLCASRRNQMKFLSQITLDELLGEAE